jgi:hypothetical protein
MFPFRGSLCAESTCEAMLREVRASDLLLENGAALTHAEPLLWQVKTLPTAADLPAAESPLFGVIPQLLTLWEAHTNKATPHKRLIEATTVDAFFALRRNPCRR